MTENIKRNIDVSWKVSEANRDKIAVARAIRSAVKSAVDDGEDVEIVVATTETDRSGFETGTFYKVRVYATLRNPIALYEDAKEAVDDMVDREAKGWSIAVEQEFADAEEVFES